ncbi:MAG: methyltransferase domain-containing protein [candidate division NC10 bacterium]|nr:methyltransferase domain-containing protein [candidate division NC10 bacterium]
MMGSEAPSQAQTIKACCADLYSRDVTRLLLGEALHPGGLALTRRLAELLGLGKEDLVLDVAAGLGASALHLAQTVGCRVEGLDLSEANLVHARRSAEEAGLDGVVRFQAGDAETLPYQDGVFDAVFSECAFCTFPDKERAAREIFRVLRPGGRLGLADVTVEQEALPDELRGIVLRAACLADAETAETYRSLFLQAGFGRFLMEEHPEALSTLVAEIRTRLRIGRFASKAGLLPFDDIDLDVAERIMAQIEALVEDGKVGYVVLIAERANEG